MKKHRKLIIFLTVIIVLTAGFFIYFAIGYHPDAKALAAMHSTDTVTVSEVETGWLFDGPSDTTAFIFYPGSKVDPESYAPLLSQIAAGGADVFLVKMPLRFALFDMDKAGDITGSYDYDSWFIGGHSLGGYAASAYAADHAGEFSGVILYASYITDDLPSGLPLLLLYGTEDGVLNMDKVMKSKEKAADCRIVEIRGGNHAQFGSYGRQRRDSDASISPEEQWDVTVRESLAFMGAGGAAGEVV
ncbi:MAG: alpha/beta hydrolase [Clostridiales bacterium]|nr:alpha/beta hydrolase [Clostridiales bacterium]